MNIDNNIENKSQCEESKEEEQNEVGITENDNNITKKVVKRN